jgi:hypothetical protein
VRCPYCGGTVGYDHIPSEIRAAAKRAGLPDPIWYAGRLMCPRYQRKYTLSDLARQSRLRADGLEMRNAAAPTGEQQQR